MKMGSVEGSRALWNRSQLALESDEVLAQLLDRGEVSTWRALYQLARTDRRFEKVIAFQDVASFVRATADDRWVARSSVRTC